VKNPNKSDKNPNSISNLKPPFQKGNTASVGYGRPKIKDEVKAVKNANYEILNELVKSGKYAEILMEVIEKQRVYGRIEVLRFLSENVIGKESVKIPSDWDLDI